MERNRSTLDTWNKLATSYQEKFMDMDMYDSTYDLLCEHVQKKNAAVLEIGCGPGNITKYLLAKRPDLKIEGIDTAPNMIELAKQNNPSADFMVMDCRDITTLTKKYDAIVCGFCMPYLSKEECVKLIQDCSALCTSGSILYFSFIEDEYSKSTNETSSNGEHTVFVYYHEQNYLRSALTKNNFESLTVTDIDYDNGKRKSKHTIMIAKKNS